MSNLTVLLVETQQGCKSAAGEWMNKDRLQLDFSALLREVRTSPFFLQAKRFLSRYAPSERKDTTSFRKALRPRSGRSRCT